MITYYIIVTYDNSWSFNIMQ